MVKRVIPQLTAKNVANFRKKFTKSEGCWIWHASKDRKGYGLFGASGMALQAHRISWTLAFGSIPIGLHILHRCDNPSCVNPDHLFPGTNAENAVDKSRKGRSMRGERCAFAKLTEAKVIEIRAKYDAGEMNQTELATEYGMAANSINGVVNRRVWKHI